jgi:hypothetical protein
MQEVVAASVLTFAQTPGYSMANHVDREHKVGCGNLASRSFKDAIIRQKKETGAGQ